MKMRMRILALVLVCVLLLPATVLANGIPGFATFNGYVTINGIPAPDGTAVDVKIGGGIVGSTTTVEFPPLSGLHGYYTCVIGHVASYSGQTVTFLVNSELAPETCVYPGEYGFATTDLTIGDTTAPTCVAHTPTGRNVDIGTEVTVTFSEAMDPATISTCSFTVSGVAGTVTYDDTEYKATFTPVAVLEYNHEYTVVLDTTITDVIGNPLASECTWSFTTGRPSGWGKCGPIDFVIVLDVTGSMGSVLASVINQLTAIVDDALIASGDDLRMGYITFDGCGVEGGFEGEADQGFGTTANGDYVTVVSELTYDIEAVKTAIGNTTLGGGAGAPEASDEAKNTAVNNLSGGNRADPSGFVGTQFGDFTEPYRDEALKIVVLITDNPPGGFNDVWDEVDTAAMHEYALDARDNDILVSDVYIGSNAAVAAIFQDDAATTGGVFVQTSSGSNVGDALLDIIEVCGEGEEEEEEVIIPEKVTKVTPPAKPAEMNIQSIYVDPEEVVQNQQVEIWVSVGNSGGTRGTKTVSLYVNGALEDSQTVGVSPGGGQNVLFNVSRAVPGTYTVSVEGREAQFTVLGMGPPQSAPAPPMAVAGMVGGLGTGGIVAIIVVVVALAIGLVVILKREST